MYHLQFRIYQSKQHHLLVLKGLLFSVKRLKLVLHFVLSYEPWNFCKSTEALVPECIPIFHQLNQLGI